MAAGPDRQRQRWAAVGGAVLLVAAIVIIIVAVLRLRPDRHATPTAPGSSPGTVGPVPSPVSVVASASPPAGPLFGERILQDYGSPEHPPEEDLTWMARALENYALLVKGDNPLPLGANEDIAAALRGRNKAHLRALPDHHPAFNAQGQIVDRWGTPLYFHAQSRDRLEIRSAGPDREMWTDDDLHRQSNGQFLRGEALLAPSLFNDSAGKTR